MAREPRSAADYIERHDEMETILGEMVENAQKALAGWRLARERVRDDPDQALTDLVEAEIDLDISIRIERADALRVIRAALNRLDRELPDDDDHSTDVP